MERNSKKIKKTVEENREDYVLIGDFNMRIGKEGGIDEVRHELRRNSKDKVISNGGKSLIELIGDIGGYILK